MDDKTLVTSEITLSQAAGLPTVQSAYMVFVHTYLVPDCAITEVAIVIIASNNTLLIILIRLNVDCFIIYSLSKTCYFITCKDNKVIEENFA